MRFNLLIVSLVCVLSYSFSQSRTITGTVKSQPDGLPLPGVSVVIQGTVKGTSTDVNGKFFLSLLTHETTLVFTYIGFKSVTTEVGTQLEFTIEMEEDIAILDEVIVVGYGIQKKTDVTGATANVKGEDLFKQPVVTATQAMQGRVAGVQIISSGQPGSSPQIRVRGVGTALSGTTSLYVVDGVLTDDISNINTSDIIDINVLKDASAAAIYGSRGANGVIIITTKKGKSGALKIDYANNIGIRQASNLVKMANTEEYANYVQAATGAAPPQSDYSTTWYKTILRSALWQNHNISVSGGDDKATHFLNVGYLNDNGIVMNNEFKRFTVRINEEFKLHDKLIFSLQSSYVNGVNENGFGNINIDAYGNIGSVYNDAYRAAPIIPSRIDGLYGNTSAYQNVGNPLLDINNNSIKVKENRLQASGFLDLKPFEWIAIRSSIGGDYRNSLNRGYYYQFNNDNTTFITSGGNQYNPRSNLVVKQGQSFRWVWDNIATITRSFGNHNLTFLVGTTSEKFNYTWISANRKDVPADPNLWYIGVGDANTSQNDGGGDAWARNSYLARINYSLAEKYLVTVTIRADGSSRLPKKNRWQEYPSVGLAWIASRENFLQSQNLFDLLKLRASYGKVGNDQIPTDAFTQTVALNKPYSFNGSVQDATNGAQINQIKDPNITWETTTEYDLALEFSLLQARLTGEVNYYNKKVDNALINVPVPKTVGDVGAVILTNVASIENKGVEVLLNWKSQVSSSFSYNISGNVTLNKNKVVALNGGQAIPGGGIGAAQGYTTYTDNGLAIGSFYVLKVLGVFNSTAEVTSYKSADGQIIQPTAKAGDFKYLDNNNDGQIDDNDRVFAGSYQPVAYFGLNLGANYKNLDFSISFYGNAGNEVYNGKKAVRISGTDNVERDVVYNRWTSGSNKQDEPRANTGNLPASTYFVESGSFARINNLTVGYNLPGTFLKKIKISRLRIYATSQNLYTLKKFSGFTAELPGDPISSGIELSAYPTTRTISFGLNVGF